MRPYLAFSIGVIALLASACALAPSPPRGAVTGPFDIVRDLGGPTIARGQFKTITGVDRAFTATLQGTLSGDVFTLVEDFAFDDGERDRKTWRLTRTATGDYKGTREDVIGEARGFQDGDVFRLEYDVRLPSENGDGIIVRFQDVLYRTASGVGNEATVGWFGFYVGDVRLRIERPAPR